MHTMPSRILLVFLDGVGLGPADPASNPLAAAELPALTTLLGRPPLAGAGDAGADGVEAAGLLLGLDATLGVPGLPQSGTGQTALLTGENAARLFGGHRGPWVPTRLRPLLRRSSMLARAAAAGRAVAFANAYPEELFGDSGARGPAVRAGPPLAALGAGVLNRHTDALRSGDAVASEITNDGWRHRLGRVDLPDPTPAEAGVTLARIAAAHELTLFAHYSTDLVGHRGTAEEAAAAMERLDAFLGGLLAALDPATTVIVVSDHGNLEDTGRSHTRNPALGLVVGPEHRSLAASLHDLRDVAGVVLSAAGVDAPTGPREPGSAAPEDEL